MPSSMTKSQLAVRANVMTSWLAVAAIATVAGCSASETTVGGDGGADAGADGTAPIVKLPFSPSNVQPSPTDFNGTGDITVSDASCTIHTERKEFSCADSSLVSFRVIDQTNAPAIGVYFVKSFKIAANADLRVIGNNAIAIVSATTIDIEGTLTSTPKGGGETAGGYRSAPTENFAGKGPGGGGAGSATNAASGGSYCGIGGLGSAAAGGSQALPSKAWGNQELVPLVGGASGGNGVLGHGGGSGGGAVQLVAGARLTISASGVVSAGGGGGNTGGAAPSQQGSGGGSGGAILLEGHSVSLEGLLAVNGGGGGPSATSGDAANGQDGLPSETPATGGIAPTDEVVGGEGSAAGTIDGGDGSQSAAGKASGGGGGAGRVRINAYGGELTIGGKMSPPEASTCVSTQEFAADAG